MTGTVKIVAQHGWAFAPLIWASWRQFLPAGWQLQAWDRGYFSGLPEQPGPNTLDSAQGGSKNSPVCARGAQAPFQVLIAHSFGLHLLSGDAITSADLLVIISGFEHFHESPRAGSRRAIGRMLARLDRDYEAVLSEFYARCFNDKPPLALPLGRVSLPDLALLSADLRRLDEGSACLNDLSGARSILLLHGEKDVIVPANLGVALGDKLPGSRLILHPESGHALPFTHQMWCIAAIEAALSQLMPRAGCLSHENDVAA